MIEVSEQVVQQINIADYLLENLSKADPCAIVAGGAPRDWKLGQPARDLDIYIYLGGGRLTASQEQSWLERLLGVKLSRIEQRCTETYKLNPHIHRVWKGNYEGLDFDIIVCNHDTRSINIVNTFPIGLCQAWYKGGSIRTTKKFRIDAKFKLLTKYGELYADSSKYITKIRSKFPDNTYVSSPEKLLDILVEVDDD